MTKRVRVVFYIKCIPNFEVGIQPEPSLLNFLFFFFFLRVLGLLICPKIAEAKIMIKHSAFLYTPQRAKKNKQNKQTKKTSVGKKWFCNTFLLGK